MELFLEDDYTIVTKQCETEIEAMTKRFENDLQQQSQEVEQLKKAMETLCNQYRRLQ